VGVVFFRPEGPITWANDAFLAMSGCTRADLAAGALRWDTLTPPEWMAASRRALEVVAGGGAAAPYEKEYVRADGSRWWALVAARRLDERTAVKFVLDRTEQRRAEVAAAWLSAIVDSSRDAIFGRGLDG